VSWILGLILSNQKHKGNGQRKKKIRKNIAQMETLDQEIVNLQPKPTERRFPNKKNKEI